ncbi:MAG TPA: VanZ family protein [Anaerolineae bacterium]|nr:VanZ family protein [Anaerolineae bacterium]
MSATHLGRRAVRWLPVLLWMAVIFYLSAQPDLPHHPEAVVDVIVKKLGHVAEYGILAALSLWALGGASSSIPRSHFLCAFALTALYAVSDELHQRFVPGRGPRPLDVGFDVVGAALALFAMSTVRRARQRPQGD